MTVRESILSACVALCTPLVNGGVYRSREAALARAEGTGILIKPDEETVEFYAAVHAKRALVVDFTVLARGQVPDQVADPVVQALHAALMADQTLGGLVARVIEEGTKWDFEEADQTAVAVSVRYRLLYLTPASSLASLV